jgi:tetrapyrrole methylase family protein/MazG family protein
VIEDDAMKTGTPGLTVVGLGPAVWTSLTIEAVEVLSAARDVYVRAPSKRVEHFLAARFPKLRVRSLEALSRNGASPQDSYRRVADELLDRARRDGNLIYAVPGSPSLDDLSLRMLLEAAGDVSVRVVEGLSVVEPVLAAVGVARSGWLQVADAWELDLLGREDALGHVEGEERRLPWRAATPTESLVVTGLCDPSLAAGARRWLSRFYPDSHPVQVVGEGRVPAVQTVALRDLDGLEAREMSTGVYVPPVLETENVRTFPGLMNLTRTLRAPGGCPWDREQTHASLKPHLLEEAYEVVDALDSGDPAVICEELGDLLFQVTIHSQLAAEAGEFRVEDVIQGIMVKLIGRHPHVFGEMELESAQDVREAWELLKQREKPKRSSVLEQIPRGLPALPQSNLMQKRAASVGFEWPGVDEVLEKVHEELGELRAEIEAGDKDLEREEFGDILFALVSVARHLRLDPEEALRLANRKFAARFQYVESRVAAEGKGLRDLSPAELDGLWNEAKALGTAPH